MTKTFIASFQNQCITEMATMEKPDIEQYYGRERSTDMDAYDLDRYHMAMDRYKCHLNSLATYPYKLTKEMDGKELVEGIDFKLEFEKYTNPDTGRRSRRILAIPLQPGNGGEEKVRSTFPDKMTFKEMLENLFDVSFLTSEELKTISDAGEMYANGCVKNALIPASPDVAEMAKDWVKRYDKLRRVHNMTDSITMLVKEVQSFRQVGEAVDISGELKEFCDKEGYTNKPLLTVMPMVIEFIQSKFNLTRK